MFLRMWREQDDGPWPEPRTRKHWPFSSDITVWAAGDTRQSNTVSKKKELHEAHWEIHRDVDKARHAQPVTCCSLPAIQPNRDLAACSDITAAVFPREHENEAVVWFCSSLRVFTYLEPGPKNTILIELTSNIPCWNYSVFGHRTEGNLDPIMDKQLTDGGKYNGFYYNLSKEEIHRIICKINH